LAAAVTSAAVVLDPDRIPEGLNEFKKADQNGRANGCMSRDLWQVADVSVPMPRSRKSKSLNILRADHLAMVRRIGGAEDAATIADRRQYDPARSDGSRWKP